VYDNDNDNDNDHDHGLAAERRWLSAVAVAVAVHSSLITHHSSLSINPSYTWSFSNG